MLPKQVKMGRVEMCSSSAMALAVSASEPRSRTILKDASMSSCLVNLDRGAIRLSFPIDII